MSFCILIKILNLKNIANFYINIVEFYYLMIIWINIDYINKVLDLMLV